MRSERDTPRHTHRSRAGCAMLLCAVLMLSSLATPAHAQGSFDTMVQHDLDFAARQLSADLTAISSATNYPSTTRPDGAWNTTGASSWTSGFFPGALWLLYQRTGDGAWRTAATQRQAGIEGQKTNAGDHDIGFKIFTSFGNGYRLTGDESYRQNVLTAASTLATRFDPDVGCIRSWGSINDTNDFEVIIDNMINLELLFWASKQPGGQRAWYDMAVSHALKTMINHVRADGSTYHVVDYNPSTGVVKSKRSAQGYAAESTWSRGQAWAIYGFTMAYRETGDPRFLDTARKTAAYFIAHLPSDSVPYWDFELPSLSGQPRDSSAAAIAASGLLELSQLEPDSTRKQTYLESATAILTALSSTSYLAEGTNYRSILLHGTRNNTSSATDSHDTGLIYGDYYFVEALLRAPTQPIPTGSVSGRVSDRETGQPLAGATITSSQATAVSDLNGSYTIAGITAGSQQLAATAPGYQRAAQTVAVPAGGSVTANFALSRATSAPIKTIMFEGGSLTGSSGADSISGSGASLDAGTPLKGAASAKIQGIAYLTTGFASVDQVYVSLYLRLNAAPTTSARIVRISNTGTTVGNLVLNTNRTLQLRNGSTSLGSPSAALALGTLYRVGLHQGKGSGANAALEAFLAQGDAAFSTSPFAASRNGAWTSQANQLQLGATNSSAVALSVDDILLDAAAMPEPSGGTPPPADTQPPTTPSGLVATALSISAIRLAWNGASDNLGVAGYHIYRDGSTVPSATVTSSTSYTDVTLAPATTYSYTVAAFDAAGNQSSRSTPASATTLADPPPPTGQLIKAITFEGGSLIGSSGADSVSGSGVVLLSGAPLKGAASARFAATASGYLTQDFAGVDDLYISLYVKVNARPTTDVRIVLISNAGTTIGNIVLRPSGALRLRVGSTVIGADTAPLATGAIYRVGVHQKKGSSATAALEAFLAQGDVAFGAPFAAVTNGNWTTQANRLRFGATNGNALDITIDDVTLDKAGMPGPSR